MRPSLSFTEESGSPTIVNLGNPDAVSASTRTRWASTPTTAAVSEVASMQGSIERRRWESPARTAGYCRPREGPRRSSGRRAAATLGVGVDRERVPRRDARALKAVPGLQGADGGLEGAGDGGQRVARLHPIADPDLAVPGRRALGRG